MPAVDAAAASASVGEEATKVAARRRFSASVGHSMGREAALPAVVVAAASASVGEEAALPAVDAPASVGRGEWLCLPPLTTPLTPPLTPPPPPRRRCRGTETLRELVHPKVAKGSLVHPKVAR